MRLTESRVARAERLASTLRAMGPYCWGAIYDVTPNEVILLAFDGAAAPAYPRFPRGAGLTGAAIARAAPVVSNDVAGDPLYLTAFASTGSELIVPVVDPRGRIVGTLDVVAEERNAFGPADVAKLSALAASCGPLFSEVVIRVARPDDAAAVADIYAPSVTAGVASFEEAPPTAGEMRKRMRATMAWTPWLCATNGIDVVGYAYASRHRERPAYRWSVDVTAYVHERFVGRGVGRRLYAELLAILEKQGFRRAFAGVALPNDASVGLHRALEFEPIGVYRAVGWKLGAWRDVAWFGRFLGSHGAVSEPSEPTPFCSAGCDRIVG